MIKGLRKCILCNNYFPKDSLLRIVRNKDGEVFVDLKGNMPGRGCYVCFSCSKEGKLKKSSLSKGLKTHVDSKLCDEISIILRNQGGEC